MDEKKGLEIVRKGRVAVEIEEMTGGEVGFGILPSSNDPMTVLEYSLSPNSSCVE